MKSIGALFMLVLAAGGAWAQEPGYRGVDVFDAACAACHIKGEGGAQRIGERAAWAKLAAQGLPALTRNVLEGKHAMPAHGGNAGLSRLELRSAIIYMASGASKRKPR